jgi:hypothetical protein
VDGHGQVLAKSNRNSDDETQRVRRARSRLLSGSTETDVEANSVDTKENDCTEGFQAWKKLEQISAQMDTGGHTLL